MTPDQALQEAVVAQRSGELQKAHAICRKILAETPDHPPTLNLLGTLLGQAGQLDQAVLTLQAALRANPSWSPAYNSLGTIYRRQEKLTEAIACFERAADLRPDDPTPLSNLGESLSHSGRHDEAIAVCIRLVKLRPTSAPAHANHGSALAAARRWEESIDAFRRAIIFAESAAAADPITVRPALAQLHNSLGCALCSLHRYDEAIAELKAAASMRPNYLEAHHHLGNAYQFMGDYDNAMAMYRAAIAIRPDYTPALWNLGLIYLKRGQFEQGWPLFDQRNRLPDGGDNRGFREPRWNGENIAGRTLLLHASGGFGDAIQYVRYVPLAAERAGKIILECQPPLVSLFKSIGEFEVIARGEQLPAFDVQISLPSLPVIFKTTLQTIPAKVPYLAAPADRIAAWRERIPKDNQLKVGLCWIAHHNRLDDDQRCCPLQLLVPLSSVPNVQFHSLQMGVPFAPQDFPNLIDHAGEIKDFADTAALMEQLDLMITVDTSVAHLAGALARPVWLLTSFNAAYQWLLERSDSPWYPTMRLFRQEKRAQWEPVVERVRVELAERCKTPNN